MSSTEQSMSRSGRTGDRNDSSEVLVSDEGSTRWLTLNRESHANTFTSSMLLRLREELDIARSDRSVRVVVLTGAGRRFFCVGGEKSDPPRELDYSTVAPVVDLYQQIDQMPKPVLAAVNGYAVGGGHVLHVMCDLTIAAESAIFRQVGPMVGSFDAGFGTWYLEDLVGRKRAKQMWFLNEKFTAGEALAMGLVNFVVPDDELHDRTAAIAAVLAKRGGQALAAVKASFAARSGGAGGFSRVAHDLLLRNYLQTEEASEMRAAFENKRDPDPEAAWR